MKKTFVSIGSGFGLILCFNPLTLAAHEANVLREISARPHVLPECRKLRQLDVQQPNPEQ